MKKQISRLLKADELENFIAAQGRAFVPDRVAEMLRKREISVHMSDLSRLQEILDDVIAEMRSRLAEMGAEPEKTSTQGVRGVSARAEKRIAHLVTLLTWQVLILARLKEYDEGLERSAEGLDWAGRIDDPVREGYLLNVTSTIYGDLKQGEKQTDVLRDAVTVARRSENHHLRSSSLNNLATTLLMSGHLEEAEKLSAESLLVVEKLDGEEREIVKVHALILDARIQGRQARWSEALGQLRRALKITEGEGHAQRRYVVLANISDLYLRLGLHRLSMEHAMEMLDLARAQKNPFYIAQSQIRLGKAYVALDDPVNARQILEPVMKDATERRMYVEAEAAVALGELAIGEEKWEEAAEYLRTARRRYGKEEFDVPHLHRQITLLLAAALMKSGDTRESEALVDEVLQSARAHGNLDETMHALVHLGELRIIQKRYDDALPVLAEALEYAGDEKTQGKEIDVHRLLVDLYDATGEHRKGLEHARQLMRLREMQFRREGEEALRSIRILHEVDMLEQEAENERLRRENAEAKLIASRQDLRGASIALTDKGELIHQIERRVSRAIERLEEKGTATVTEGLRQILLDIRAHTAMNGTAMHYLQRVDEQFFAEVRSRHPDLTAGQVRLCGLIRAGLTSSDIASILHITPESLKKARTRLRKKLGIDAGVRLDGYLAEIAAPSVGDDASGERSPPAGGAVPSFPGG